MVQGNVFLARAASLSQGVWCLQWMHVWRFV